MSALETLAQCKLFAGIPERKLRSLAKTSQYQAIHSGAPLYQVNDTADALYVIASGRLRAHTVNGRTLGDVGRGEVVGEIDLFTEDRKRHTTVHAIRDSVVLRVEMDEFIAFADNNPGVMHAVTSTIILRLRRARRAQELESGRQHRVFSVVGATPDIDCASVAHALVDALKPFGEAEYIDAARIDSLLGPGTAQTPMDADTARLITYLNQLEAANPDDYLVYCADPNASAWSRRCVRQSDRTLLVVRNTTDPETSPMVQDVLQSRMKESIELVILRPLGASAGNVAAWAELIGTHRHHYVDIEHRGMTSLTRQLCGRGLGLVLGGGGARGFAHIGLLKAMEELRLPIDLVAGASMGAFFGALVACGMDYRQVLEVTRETFVQHNYLNDYTLPRVSLIRGRKILRQLEEIFGQQRIETLWTPFFCVSSNLTRGVAKIHDSGDVAMWVGTSMAIPGIVPPVAWHGELFADGALVNTLPTDVLHHLGRGPIIASDVSTHGAIAAPGVEEVDPEFLLHQKGSEKISLLDILFRTATMTSTIADEARNNMADLPLHMPVENVGLFDWTRLDEIVERGYQHAMEKLVGAHDSLGLPLDTNVSD